MEARIFRSCSRGFAALLLAVLLPGWAWGEVEHPAKPLLWKIEGKDLVQPSYLFGTIHIGSAAVVTLHVAGALKHHFIDRDALLLRMWPGRG